MSLRKTVTTLLLAALVLPLCGAELLENPDFSKKHPSGYPVNWAPLNGTRGKVDGNVMTLENSKGGAVMIQHVRPRPGKRVVFSVEVKCDTPCKMRAYLETAFLVNGKNSGFSSGGAWQKNEPGKWITLSGELSPLPEGYKDCYLAIWNDTGKPMQVRNPHVELGSDVWLSNADFSRKNGKDAVNWLYRGKMPQSLAFNGSAVKLADGFLIQMRLPLSSKKLYRLSFLMRGTPGSQGRGYVEWNVRKDDGKTAWGGCSSTGWQKTSPQWKEYSVSVKIAANTVLCYVVLAAKDKNAVEFKDVKIEEVKPAADLGGSWELRKHSYGKDGLILLGKEWPAVLHNIPVKAGKKYELSYDVCVLEDHVLSDDGGFFRVRSTVSPVSAGTNGTADVLHGKVNAVQKRVHIFTASAAGKVNFTVSAQNPGKARLNHFQLRELPVKDSDFWSMKIVHPFYRDAFYPGDDLSKITGEAQTAGADRLRITFNGKVTEFPVTGKVTKFMIPFHLPEGKYAFRCDFLKNGKVEKSFTRTIARFPKAATMVTVSPDKKIRINGKVFFPVKMSLRGEYNDASLYHAARNGVNSVLIHISHEEELLRKLDLAHKYGIKAILYPSPAFKAAQLPGFRKAVKTHITPKVMAHPALLAYGMPDEPMLAGVPVPVIREDYRILKEHDPYHICWTNLAPRNEVEDLKPYGEACDLLSVDVYPVPYPNGHPGIADKSPACCGKYALRLDEIGCGKKAVGVYLQGFAWHECSGPDAVKKRYPTRAESRFMAYDTLLNGGIGYWLWGVQCVQSKEFFRFIYTMTRELHKYSGLFSEGKQLADLKTDNPAVRCAVMEYKGQKYYFLLNMSAKPQKAVTAARGKVLDSDGGSFNAGKVSLAPYEVIAVSAAALPPPQYALPARNEALERAEDPAFADIDKLNHTLKAPFYKGNANWIWYKNGQEGMARCFAEKKFTVKAGEKVTLKFSADDSAIVYLNGKEILKNAGWSHMLIADLSKLVRPGENRLLVLGIDAGAAPCGLIAELQVGGKTIVTDGTWKVRAAYKGDPIPASMEQDANAVIVAPYGGGAWGKGVRVFTD